MKDSFALTIEKMTGMIRLLINVRTKRAGAAMTARYAKTHKAAMLIMLVAFIFAITMAPFSTTNVHAFPQIPYSVRIGVFYNSSSADTQAAQSYQIYSMNGVSLGRVDEGGNSSHLFDFSFPDASKKMVVSKLAYNKSYAVMTGRETNSFFDVSARVKGLQQKGYDPQLAYFNGWVLAVDFFDSMDAAQQAIDSTLASEFPGFGFTAEKLSGKYLMVAIGNTRQFIFDANTENLRVMPKAPDDAGAPALIDINGKTFRGALEIMRKENNDMTVVNIVAMDDYLYGVVPREIEASSPAAALKAQAVAARSYAVITIGKHGSSGFDMCCTTHCQVYGGYESEDARSSGAVDDTKWEIVSYRGAPAEVYYFSSSGGHTANINNVWNSDKEYPYLAGVEDKYESGLSYNYEWETVYTAQEIKSKLLSNGINIGDIVGLAVTGVAKSGHAIEVTITGTNGAHVFSNGACRTFLPNLHSQMYTVFAVNPTNAPGGKTYYSISTGGVAPIVTGNKDTIGAGARTAAYSGNGGMVVSSAGYTGLPASGASFRFVGRGWGHGVGMSQEGAKGMAKAGFTYKEILTHYFPGCEVR